MELGKQKMMGIGNSEERYDRVLRRAENVKENYWLRFMRPISLLLFPRLDMGVVFCIDYQRSERMWKNVNR
jgi:hypothetical protein